MVRARKVVGFVRSEVVVRQGGKGQEEVKGEGYFRDLGGLVMVGWVSWGVKWG